MNMRWPIVLVTLAALALGGCAASMKAKKRFSGRLAPGARVAVLPFDNLSNADGAAQVITDYFYLTLTPIERVNVLENSRVYEGLRKYRVRTARTLTNDQIDSLRLNFDMDYLLVGTVSEYDQVTNQFLGSVPRVSFTCRLIETATKKTVWVGVANGRGDKGELFFGLGAISSIDVLSRAMVENMSDELTELFPPFSPAGL